MYRLENVSISVFVCRHVMMLSVAGRDLDGLLSPPAPWVGWPSALLDENLLFVWLGSVGVEWSS